MIAAPRLATVGMKSSAIHAWSLTTSAAFLPPTSAWNTSGYWVAEWLPQMVIFLMSVTAAPVFLASCEMARLWSRRGSAENRSFGMSGAVVIPIHALGLGGVPGTPPRMSSAGNGIQGLPPAGDNGPLDLAAAAPSIAPAP